MQGLLNFSPDILDNKKDPTSKNIVPGNGECWIMSKNTALLIGDTIWCAYHTFIFVQVNVTARPISRFSLVLNVIRSVLCNSDSYPQLSPQNLVYNNSFINPKVILCGGDVFFHFSALYLTLCRNLFLVIVCMSWW